MKDTLIEISEEPTIALDAEDTSTGRLSLKMGISSILGTRKNQQDSVFGQVDGENAVAIVCDGMGGLSGGELASQAAVRLFVEDYYKNPSEYDIPAFLRREAYKMNTVVRELMDEDGTPLDAGTTVVATVIEGNRLHWLSVGDSKLYIIRNGEIASVNQEHNLRMKLEEQRREGMISEEQYHHGMERADALISYLGIQDLEMIEVNPKPLLLLENDIVLLCSDGLYKSMEAKEIERLVYYEEPDMNRAARRLTDIIEKKKKHSQDNTSIVIMQYNRY